MPTELSTTFGSQEVAPGERERRIRQVFGIDYVPFKHKPQVFIIHIWQFLSVLYRIHGEYQSELFEVIHTSSTADRFPYLFWGEF